MELKYKFRALTKDNKEWVYGLPMYDYRCVAGKSESVLCIQESSDTSIKLKYEIIPETLCESTGLKDKNGKEIYEGDIYHQGDVNILYIVEWHDTGFMGRQARTVGSYAGLSYWRDRIEVIGNIHEIYYDNPELLQEVSNE